MLRAIKSFMFFIRFFQTSQTSIHSLARAIWFSLSVRPPISPSTPSSAFSFFSSTAPILQNTLMQKPLMQKPSDTKLSNVKLSDAKLFLLALCSSFLYACTDELHQLFVSGRSGQFTDVLIDTLGALFGCLLLLMIRRLRKAWRARRRL